jgi:hypothetical protein
MSEVFVVVHDDSRYDPAVYVFATEAWARKLVSRIIGDCALDGQYDDTLTPEMEADGRIYNAYLNPDGDSVWIERKPILDEGSAAFDKEH